MAHCLPSWKATFFKLDIPAVARPRELLAAEITVSNAGELAWSRRSITNRDWPVLNLGAHLLDARARVIEPDYYRVALPRTVRPGGSVTFVFAFSAPATAGHFVLEWDMVSEQETWFAACGSAVARVPLQVTP